MADDLNIPISALQHYAFCPRQCALIHIERLWAENFLTAEGQILHQNVDSGLNQKRKLVRTEFAVEVKSEIYHLIGKLDALEIIGNKTLDYIPIEYKRGKPKVENHDRIQLCAQALCLEEMLNINIQKGALWYWQTRHREWIELTESLRNETIGICQNTYKLFQEQKTPKAIYDKKCKACSLVELCQPRKMTNDKSLLYNQLFFKE